MNSDVQRHVVREYVVVFDLCFNLRRYIEAVCPYVQVLVSFLIIRVHDHSNLSPKRSQAKLVSVRAIEKSST